MRTSEFDGGWPSKFERPAPAKLTYKWERFPAILREFVPVLQVHYQETATYPKQLPIEPNFDQLCQMDEMGMLLTLTVRHEGKLVGYLLATVGAHLNFVMTQFSTAYMYYLAPEYRRGWNGVRMFRIWISAMRKRGIRVLQVAETIKVRGRHGRHVGILMRYLGFKCVERSYSRLLGG